MMKKLRSLFTMRYNRIAFLFLLLLCSFMTCFSFWSTCGMDSKPERTEIREPAGVGVLETDRPLDQPFDSSMHFVNRNAKNYNVGVNEMDLGGGGRSNGQDIDCEINNEYTIQCRREDNEIYMPFSFIQKYFEVYGETKTDDGVDKFEFSHSYSLVHPPPDVIRPDGIFMSFEHYNVEIRKRVKCITAIEGVPLSTQWEPSGHFYPIQIAQFGLSHYSKYLTEGEPDRESLLTGEEEDLEDWMVDGKASVRSMWDKTRESQVIEIQSPDYLSNPGLYVLMKERNNFALTFDGRIISNGSITATLRNDESTFHVHYVFSNTLITCEGKNVYYGLGENRRGKWIHFARDINMDLMKGMELKCSKFKKNKEIVLLSISIRGHGWIDNVTLASAAHMDHFINAANWFVNHQDDRGGWPIMVVRKLIPGIMELPSGWYSAMAQGHAMSTLVRAYLRTKNQVYLRAAEKGLKLFEINSAQGGVRAKFADTYDWYEEYPTQPSSYVLNGFIYSLFGLYDLKMVTQGDALSMVTDLYDKGMKSLKAMVLMFDTGSGTFYDLRHLSKGLAPNRARWDYHTVHISQMLQLAKMDDDPLFARTAKRWEEYMKGRRSPHN